MLSRAECAADEFDCDDDTCIAGDLKCNDRNNCKFLKDEADCPKVSTAFSELNYATFYAPKINMEHCCQSIEKRRQGDG